MDLKGLRVGVVKQLSSDGFQPGVKACFDDTIEKLAAAGAEISATSIATTTASVAGRSSRFFGRVGTTAAASARFIPIAGGLLSAACVVVEGKELKKTVSKINEGNPCAKAEQIRSIRDEMTKFPDSSVIADECRRVFEIAEKECAFF